jgi:hypothetical protein
MSRNSSKKIDDWLRMNKTFLHLARCGLLGFGCMLKVLSSSRPEIELRRLPLSYNNIPLGLDATQPRQVRGQGKDKEKGAMVKTQERCVKPEHMLPDRRVEALKLLQVRR